MYPSLCIGMNARIYKITCLVTEKIYVGQTYKPIEVRFSRHCGYASYKNLDKSRRVPIVNAIKKYGKENFMVELLEEIPENVEQKYVDDREIYWGMKLNSLAPNGYNLRLGTGRGGAISKSTLKKLKIKRNSRPPISDETREKMRLSRIGHRITEETKRKIGLSNKGKGAKVYTLISPGGESIKVKNLAQFYKDNNLGRGITNITTGRIKSYKGWTCERN